jgi:hypothetical protein
VRAEEVDSNEARKVLRNLGLEPHQGSNNDVSELWLTASGHPESIPFFRRGDRTSFLRCAFDELVDKLT